LSNVTPASIGLLKSSFSSQKILIFLTIFIGSF
jgi:hypothetical protein